MLAQKNQRILELETQQVELRQNQLNVVVQLQERNIDPEEEAYPWKVGASSGHITNLKQSILETFDIYARSKRLS